MASDPNQRIVNVSPVQMAFLKCRAIGAMYGGEAGSGKTFLLQNESMHWAHLPNYTGIIFRREAVTIRRPGGMWSTGEEMYRLSGGKPNRQDLTVRWPKSGGMLQYCHLETESDKYSHHGDQVGFLAFDEVQEISFTNWAYMITRNRPRADCTMSSGYFRMTGNADARAWVRHFLDWWIPPPPAPGIPYPDRCGVIRHFVIRGAEAPEVVWVDEDYRDEDGNPPIPFTFFAARLEDNPVKGSYRKEYRRRIAAMDDITRARLGKGDWNAIEGGGMFKSQWFKYVDRLPEGIRLWRYWDFAATKPKKEADDPDWTSGALCGIYGGDLYIVDITTLRDTPAKVEEKVKECADQDGYNSAVSWEEEKGSAGKYLSNHLQTQLLSGFECHPDPVSGEKEERAKPWASLAEHEHVYLKRGAWNRDFLLQASTFPHGKKDQVDSVSGCYKMLFQTKLIWPDYKFNDDQKDPANNADFIIDFKNTHKEQATITIFITEEGGDINILFAMWGRKSQKLFIYNEITQRNLSLEDTATLIGRKAEVPIHSKDDLCVDKFFIESKLGKGGDDFRKLVRNKMNVFIRENRNYDEIGGIITIRSLIKSSKFFVHKSCTETIRSVREWSYADNTQGKPMPGYPLCRALCGVVGDLKLMKEIVQPELPKPYSRESREILEKLKKYGRIA